MKEDKKYENDQPGIPEGLSKVIPASLLKILENVLERNIQISVTDCEKMPWAMSYSDDHFQAMVIEKSSKEIDTVITHLSRQDEKTIKNSALLSLVLLLTEDFRKDSSSRAFLSPDKYQEQSGKFRILFKKLKDKPLIREQIYTIIKNCKARCEGVKDLIEDILKKENDPKALLVFYLSNEIYKNNPEKLLAVMEKLSYDEELRKLLVQRATELTTELSTKLARGDENIAISLLLMAKRLTKPDDIMNQVSINIDLYLLYNRQNKVELAIALLNEIEKLSKNKKPNTALCFLILQKCIRCKFSTSLEMLYEQACKLADSKSSSEFVYIHLKKLNYYRLDTKFSPNNEKAYQERLAKTKSLIKIILNHLPRIQSDREYAYLNIKEELLCAAEFLFEFENESLTEAIILFYEYALKMEPKEVSGTMVNSPKLFLYYNTNNLRKTGKIDPASLQQILNFKPDSPSEYFSTYHKLALSLIEKGDLTNAEAILYKTLSFANAENYKIICDVLVHHFFLHVFQRPSDIKESKLSSASIQLSKTPSLTHARDKNGKTLLHHCAERNLINIIPFLVDEKNINVQDNNGNTPLHLAVLQGNLDFIKNRFLNYLNVNLELRNKEGKTLLDIAVEKHGRTSAIYKELYKHYIMKYNDLKRFTIFDKSQLDPSIFIKMRRLHRGKKARKVHATNAHLEFDIPLASRTNRWIKTLNIPMSIPSLEKQALRLKESYRINKRIERLNKMRPEEYQLIESRERLRVTILNLHFDFQSATHNEIKGDALLSKEQLAKRGIEYVPGKGLPPGANRDEYVYGHWLPRGSHPLRYVSETDKRKVFVIDGDLLNANTHLFIRDEDRAIYAICHDTLESYQFGKVHYCKKIIVDKGTTFKVITVTGPDGQTREFRHKYGTEIIMGKFNKEMIANDVDEMITQIASVDVQSALDLLKSFSGKGSDIAPTSTTLQEQQDCASKLCLAVNRYEASVISDIPFHVPSPTTKTGDAKETALLREVHRIDKKQVDHLYASILTCDFDAVRKIIEECQSQKPRPDPEHKDACCYVNKFIVDAQSEESKLQIYGTPLIFSITLLHQLKTTGQLEKMQKALAIIKLLVEKKADINARQYNIDPNKGRANGYDALMMAAEFGELDIVKLLVENCANLAACIERKGIRENALKLAQKNNHTEVVKYLISKGARNVDGSIPSQAVDSKIEAAPSVGKGSSPIRDEKTVSHNPQTLAEINALAHLMFEMRTDTGCSAKVDGNNLIFDFDIHVEYDEGGVHYPNLPIVPHALGARLYFSDKKPLECRDYDRFEMKRYCVPLTGKIMHENTPHDHDAFHSLEEVRDRLMTRELDTLLTCAQNYDYFLTHGKKHPKTGDGATSSFNKNRFRNLRLDGFKIKAQVLSDQTIGIIVLENSEKESHAELVLKQLQRHLGLKADDLAIKEITINRNGQLTLAKQINIKLSPSALIERLKEKRTNFHGVVLVDEQGRIALADRKNSYEQKSKGYAGAGGHCTHPYSEQLGAFSELKHEFNLDARDESKTLQQSELISKTRHKALWLVHANAVKVADTAIAYTKSKGVPFEADRQEFVSGTECYLSFNEIRGIKLPLRNISSLDLYLEFEQKRINKTIASSSEFKECNDVQITIPARCQIKDGVRIPEDDFGIIRIDAPEGQKDQIPVFLRLLARHFPEKLEIRNGNEIVNVNPYTFYELTRKIAQVKQDAASPKYVNRAQCL